VAVYSYGQLEQLWIDAGGPKALAPLMAAIALAESGGNPAANNYTDNGGTQTSWGLWQISNGTHTAPVANINDPLVNAKQAVAKYNSQGLSAWGTYDSGAYRQYYQGSTPAASLPQTGGGGGTQDATLTAFNPGNVNWAGGPQGIIESAAQAVANMFTQGVTGGVSTATGISGVWQALTAIGTDLNAMMKSVEWLFVPGHWIRIICFGNGVVLGLLGVRSLSRASDGGSSLAAGILLVTLSGVFLFLAFHNLPDDVKDFQGLLGFISDGIRHKSDATGAKTTAVLE
jgi:hypothetical protein